MKKYYYFIVEGVHDTAALWRFLKLKGFKKVIKLEELDSFWRPTIPTKFPHDNDLLKRVPVPSFFNTDEVSIAIQAAGSDSKIIKSFNSLSVIDYEDLAGISIFCDADTLTASERFANLHKELSDNLSEEFVNIIEGISFKTIKQATTKFGIYIFPDNENKGTLEALLLDGGVLVYPELIQNAKAYVSQAPQIKDSLVIKELKKWSISSEEKVLLGVAANIIKPGRANQNSIEDNSWISSETLSSNSQNKLKLFIDEFLS